MNMSDLDSMIYDWLKAIENPLWYLHVNYFYQIAANHYECLKSYGYQTTDLGDVDEAAV